ncbi:MAG TPA: Arm DNA-binding domain-containing protein [Burkholderiales bacterium]
MHLYVMPNASKYWRLKYRFQGKEKRLALGVYPDVSLTEALASVTPHASSSRRRRSRRAGPPYRRTRGNRRLRGYRTTRFLLGAPGGPRVLVTRPLAVIERGVERALLAALRGEPRFEMAFRQRNDAAIARFVRLPRERRRATGGGRVFCITKSR